MLKKKSSILVTGFIRFMEDLLISRPGRMVMKKTMLLLIFLMWVPISVMGRSGNANISSSRPHAVNFGAIFTLDSVIGRSARPAVMAAINDINSDSTVLPGTKVNLILRDTNCSGFLGTIEGIPEAQYLYSSVLFLG